MLGPELLKEVLAIAASTAMGSFRRAEHDPDEVAIQEWLIWDTSAISNDGAGSPPLRTPKKRGPLPLVPECGRA